MSTTQAFVNAYLQRLQPGADSDWKRDRKLTQAYLESLQTFVGKLPVAFNSLKAHVLYHRLVFDRAGGTYDKDRFIEYLKLPRFQGYMSKAMLESQELRRHPADLNAEYSPVTLLPRVGSDEELVRSYLKHFFVDAAGTKDYEPYINDVYLTHLFAETKAENGLGDAEEWASKLPPELFRAIKDRIDIDFASTNKTDYAVDEPVKLELFVKNVPTLLVKVFEINTSNVYRTTLREIDTDINLDGLVANSEKSHAYSEAPLRRVAADIRVPGTEEAGRVRHRLHREREEQPGAGPQGSAAAGGDDRHGGAERPRRGRGEPSRCRTRRVWLGGAEYTPDKNGVVTVPYSNAAGPAADRAVGSGDFASLDYLDHQAESYRLAAGFHLDRESLLTQRVANLIVRPGLYLNGIPVSTKLLDECKLRITSTDLYGIATAVEMPEFKLFEDRESTHEIRVPARTASIAVQLIAKVKNLEHRQDDRPGGRADVHPQRHRPRPTRSRICTSRSSARST